MHELNNELSLLVLLTRLVRLLVLPAERGLAALAVDVGDGMQPGEQVALFGLASAHVDHVVEEVGSSLAALKRLGYEVLLLGQVRATVRARVHTQRVGQVLLECFHVDDDNNDGV